MNKQSVPALPSERRQPNRWCPDCDFALVLLPGSYTRADGKFRFGQRKPSSYLANVDTGEKLTACPNCGLKLTTANVSSYNPGLRTVADKVERDLRLIERGEYVTGGAA